MHQANRRGEWDQDPDIIAAQIRIQKMENLQMWIGHSVEHHQALLRRVNKNFTGHIIPAWSPATEITFVPRLQIWSLVTISSIQLTNDDYCPVLAPYFSRDEIENVQKASNFLGAGKMAWSVAQRFT